VQLEKVTKRYHDACGLAHALELIGERWALLVLRELMMGQRRFSELKADLPGISANVLTQRLGELERRGLVRKTKLPPPASVQVYEATDWGIEARPVMGQFGKWAARSPLHDPTLPISHVSVMLSLETMIDPERAKGMEATIGFRMGDVDYVGKLANGRLEIERGDTAGADVIFSAQPAALVGVVYGGAPLESIGVVGVVSLAGRFVRLFPLPPKASS
jgi:DNA-binding HxlR family transcriptional regulator